MFQGNGGNSVRGLPKDLDISPDPLIFAVVFASASFFWPTATNMVWKGLWLAELERALVSRLLQSQHWHNIVGRIHQRVQYHRHGVPMEESRTSLSDGNQLNRFLKYFKEELQDQAKGKPPNKL